MIHKIANLRALKQLFDWIADDYDKYMYMHAHKYDLINLSFEFIWKLQLEMKSNY